MHTSFGRSLHGYWDAFWVVTSWVFTFVATSHELDEEAGRREMTVDEALAHSSSSKCIAGVFTDGSWRWFLQLTVAWLAVWKLIYMVTSHGSARVLYCSSRLRIWAVVLKCP